MLLSSLTHSSFLIHRAVLNLREIFFGNKFKFLVFFPSCALRLFVVVDDLFFHLNHRILENIMENNVVCSSWEKTADARELSVLGRERYSILNFQVISSHLFIHFEWVWNSIYRARTVPWAISHVQANERRTNETTATDDEECGGCATDYRRHDWKS